MGKNFTPTDDQKKILESSNKNLLVSASAGSGKTATLIEKIFDLTINKNVDLNELLVITFTEAASSEMKLRLKKKFYEFGENSLQVRKQIEKLNTSDICTLHSFCAKLIRKYFYSLDLNPNFVVLSEENAKFLKVKALSEVFDFYSNNSDEDFVELSSIFGGRNFEIFKTNILSYYEFLCSIANKENYLKNIVESCYVDNLKVNASCKILNEYLLDNFYFYKKSFEEYLQKAKEQKADYFVSFIENTIKKIELIDYNKEFLENRQSLTKIEFENITRKKLDEVNNNFKEDFKDFYKDFKEKVADIKKNIFCELTEEEIVDNLNKAKIYLKKFNEVESFFEEKYNNLKLRKNVLDFNDLEKYCLKLLENGEVLDCLNDNYKYIFVDEYQDINEIQESILLQLSKKANMVMVGDIKQSIYGFRNSTPLIFINKSEKYEKNEKEGKLVNLNDNFRSKKEILNFVNEIFSKIMATNFGGVDYKNTSLLNGKSDFEKVSNFADIKLCLVDTSCEKEDSEQTTQIEKVYSVLDDKNEYQKIVNKERIEAMIIADNILKLVNKESIFDNKSNTARKITFNDIAILGRNNDFLKNVCNVLQEYKIPISTSSVENVFLDADVNVLVSLLKLISSMHDDISLCTVLNSKFGNVDYNELGIIRKYYKEEKSFYDCVKKYVLNGEQENIKNKLKAFFDLIEDLRFKHYSCNYSIFEIFNYLQAKFDFLTYFKSLPNGCEREQTVKNYINSFNGADFNDDIDKYLNFVDNFEQNNKFVSLLNSSDNSVKVGTIHSSKGLEYPIVFICGLDKNFSNQTFLSPILKDSQYGLGISTYNLVEFNKKENLARNAININLRKKEKAEELRLLYVGLTRAKNHLILVGHANIKSMSQIKNYKDAQNANSYIGWVLSGLSQIGFNGLKNGKKQFVDKHSNFEIDVEVKTKEDFVFEQEKITDLSFLSNIEDKNNLLKKYIDFNFNTTNNIALKNTVSSMLQEYAKEDNASCNFEPKKLTIFEDKIDRTKVGTIYHSIMQKIDFNYEKCATKEYLQQIVNDLNLEEKYKQKINLEEITTCINNIKKFNIVTVLKEQPFLSYVSYNKIFSDSKIKDKILIQGVADLILKTDKGFVLIDYKTNRVNNSDQLVEKYYLQLMIYKDCLEKAMDIKFGDVYLYSFCLNKLIKVF